MSAIGRSLPHPDADSGPFWAAAREGLLRIQRCRRCATFRFYPRLLCPQCWSADVDWVESAGRGTVYSVSVVHRAPSAAFAAQVPYAVCLVDLDEGPRIFARLDAGGSGGSGPAERAAVGIGDRVAIGFEAVTPDISLPFFRLLGDAA